ncbi:unnamed protein product [Lactuca saligna]|uniref:ENTH domain-containing protein n=1 Tax=Lactuca saligna TaxID=75948 RepID=A0AA36A479_LACSI|nr:unnamed protein product [Lactuca saligna]
MPLGCLTSTIFPPSIAKMLKDKEEREKEDIKQSPHNNKSSFPFLFSHAADNKKVKILTPSSFLGQNCKRLINQKSMGRFGKAIKAVKDQTSIRLAKHGHKASLADLDVAILKATSHDENPPDEHLMVEILTLTTDSPLYVASCVNTISRRLSKTRNWIVALKTLMLVQRLLHDGGPAYEQEVFFATRRGTRLLNMSDFRDALKSSTWDYAAFVRAYALFLDEQLEYKMEGKKGIREFSQDLEQHEFMIQGRKGKHGSRSHDLDQQIEFEMQGRIGRHGSCSYVQEGGELTLSAAVTVPVREMTMDQLFARVNHLMQLLDRFLACRPAGGARIQRLVLLALYPVLIQSFQLYKDIVEIMGVLKDKFEMDDLNISHSVKVYGIFRRVSKQYEELDMFYYWCKTASNAKNAEYPEVDKISQKDLDAMDERVKEKSGVTN